MDMTVEEILAILPKFKDVWLKDIYTPAPNVAKVPV